VANAAKILSGMRNNPRNWRIEDLNVLANHFGIDYRQTRHEPCRFQVPGRNTSGAGGKADQPFVHSAVRGPGGRRTEQGGNEMKRDDLRLEQYRFTVRPMTDEEGTGYAIEFPDVPLCLSDGATVEEAIVNGRDALKCCLLTMKEFGDPIPKPGSAGVASGQFRLRVPKTIHARLTSRAEHEGVSLNTLVTAMIAEGLGKRKAR
jgi:antitoxin HicB